MVWKTAVQHNIATLTDLLVEPDPAAYEGDFQHHHDNDDRNHEGIHAICTTRGNYSRHSPLVMKTNGSSQEETTITSFEWFGNIESLNFKWNCESIYTVQFSSVQFIT